MTGSKNYKYVSSLQVEPALHKTLIDKFVHVEDFCENVDSYFNDSVYYINSFWYSHEEDLKQLSLEYQNHLFILLEEENNYGSILWVKYFKNGKMQFSRSTVDDFDESGLV